MNNTKLTREQACDLLDLCIMHFKFINKCFDEMFEAAACSENKSVL